MEQITQQQKTNIVELEIKVQTIYYETSTGKIEKEYHTGNKRLSLKVALDILQEKGITTNLVLRVLTERLTISLTDKQLNESIVKSETFYKKN